MKHITSFSIREYLKELKRTKSKHPEVLNELKSYWKHELNNRLKHA